MAVQLNIVGRFDDKDLQRAQRSLQRLRDEAGKTGSGIRSSFANVGDKMKGIGSSLTSSLTLPIVGAAGVATKWASDAAEAANKVQTVFGKNAVFIDKWSQNSAKAFGISQGQAQDYFGSVGTMLQGFGIDAQALPSMSNDVLTLAADLGSFHNLDTAEVLDMISASFRGEFDSVQRVIPTINAAAVETEALAQTGKKNAKELTQQEKALATYSLLMKGAGPAVGDFAKTSDGAANSVKIAQAQLRTAAETIGKVFLPFVAKGAAIVAELAERFRNLSPGTRKIIVVVGALAAALGPLLVMLGSVATAIAAISWPVVAVVAAIGALVAAFVLLYRNNETFRTSVQRVVQAIRNGLGAAFTWFRTTVIPAVKPVLVELGTFMQALFARIVPIVRTFVAIWQAQMRVVVAVVQAVWPSVRGVIEGAMRIIQGVIRTVTGIITGDWRKAFSGLGQIVSGAFGVVKSIIGGAISGISALFRSVGGVIGRALSGIANAMSAPFRAGADAIKRLWNSTIGGKGITIPDIPGLPGRGRRFEIPRLHQGGVVPGMVGKEVPAILQAGEGVLSIKQMAAIRNAPVASGGVTYNITVEAGINDPAEVGRRVVDTIRSYERLNGPGWRAA